MNSYGRGGGVVNFNSEAINTLSGTCFVHSAVDVSLLGCTVLVRANVLTVLVKYFGC